MEKEREERPHLTKKKDVEHEVHTCAVSMVTAVVVRNIPASTAFVIFGHILNSLFT